MGEDRDSRQNKLGPANGGPERIRACIGWIKPGREFGTMKQGKLSIYQLLAKATARTDRHSSRTLANWDLQNRVRAAVNKALERVRREKEENG